MSDRSRHAFEDRCDGVIISVGIWRPPMYNPRMAPARRGFLRLLAGSPLLAGLPSLAWQDNGVLGDPKDALNVMDFEAAARKALPPAHYGYMATGVDDDYTLKANHEAYKRIQLRPRRLVDVREASTQVNLFGTAWDSPIFLCPCGYHKAFHPEGEIATARAARARKSLMALSTVTTTPLEEVKQAYGAPVWYQLYATSSWPVTEKLVKRAENVGCPVLVWTIDLMAGRNTETQAPGYARLFRLPRPRRTRPGRLAPLSYVRWPRRRRGRPRGSCVDVGHRGAAEESNPHEVSAQRHRDP